MNFASLRASQRLTRSYFLVLMILFSGNFNFSFPIKQKYYDIYVNYYIYIYI